MTRAVRYFYQAFVAERTDEFEAEKGVAARSIPQQVSEVRCNAVRAELRERKLILLFV